MGLMLLILNYILEEACLTILVQMVSHARAILSVMEMWMEVMQLSSRDVLAQFHFHRMVIACPVLMEYINTIAHTKIIFINLFNNPCPAYAVGEWCVYPLP